MTSDKPKPKLQPCPFCGRVKGLSVEGWFRSWWVDCDYTDCLTQGPTGKSREQAVRLWNRRPKR